MSDPKPIDKPAESVPPGSATITRSGSGRGGWLRTTIISVTAALLAAVILVGSVQFLFHTGSPVLTNRIMTILNRAVTTDSTRFESDRIHGALFQGAVAENPRLLVRTPEGEITWARAKRLRVDYDLWAVLSGRPQDLRIVLEGPRVDLVHDRRGELVLPRFVRRRAGGRLSEELRIDVVVRDGGFSIDRSDIRFGGIGGHGVLAMGPRRTALRIEELVGSSETPSRPGKLVLSGETFIENGVLSARPLEITLGASRLTAHAAWDLAEARVRQGRLALHPLQAREFFRAFDLRSADGVVQGEVTFSGTPTNGEARACLEGTYSGETIDTLVVSARSRPGAVDLSALRLRVGGSEFTGSGTLFTRGLVTADLGFRGVNPALLPWWKAPKNTPPGALNGSAKITARRIAPRVDGTFAVTLAPSRLGKVAIERGFLRLHARPDGSADFDSSWVQVAGGWLGARGRLGADRSIRASVDGRVESLARLRPLLGPVAATSGSGRVTGRIAGTLDAPTFVAQTSLFQARLENGVAGDTVTVEAQGRLLPDVEVTADIGVRGLRYRERRWGDVDAIVRGGRTLRVERYRQTLGDTVLALEGVVELAKEGVTARVDSLSLIAGEHRVRNRGAIRVASIGEHLRVHDLVLELDPGTLIADLDWNPHRGTVDLRARLEDVELGRIPELKRRRTRFAGLVRADVMASGTTRDPDVSVRAEVIEPTVGDFAGDSLVLDLDYSPGVLTVGQAFWAEGRSRVRLSGSIRPEFALEEWWRALGRGDPSWASRAELALAVSADSFDLELLAPVDSSLRSLSGLATVQARLAGTPAAPALDLVGVAPRISYRGVQGAIEAAEWTYAAQRLRVVRFEVRQNESVSRVRGEVPVDLSLHARDRLIDDGPLALHVEIPNGDLSIARLIFPEIGTSGGVFGASARVSGTPRTPVVNGTLRVSNGRIRMAGREEIVDRVSLDATFDNERLTVIRATGRQGERGRIEASGYWAWPTTPAPTGVGSGFGPRGEYRFHVTTTQFTATDRENYLFRFTGAFDAVNARNVRGATVPSITGHALVDKAELTLDLARPSNGVREPTPFLYHVSVEVPGNFFYRNLDAEVELETEGPLVFKNEGNGDLALGVLEVRGGQYYVLTREFRNLQGTVHFNSPDRIDPDVSIVGETALPQSEGEPRIVYLAISDRMSQLKVTVYDAEGTPPNDLWKALAFGQFVPGYSVSSAEAGGSDADVLVPISNYLFQNVERWIGSTGFIDTIDLRGGGLNGGPEEEDSPISAFGVGKYVTPELYFRYSREFSGQADEQISADYRVTRHLLLKGQQIRDRTGDKPPEYNLDLKIRLEY
jgi:hypothetical protein